MPDDAHDQQSEEQRQEDGQREQGVRSEDSEDLSSPQFTVRAGDEERTADAPRRVRGGTDRAADATGSTASD